VPTPARARALLAPGTSHRLVLKGAPPAGPGNAAAGPESAAIVPEHAPRWSRNAVCPECLFLSRRTPPLLLRPLVILKGPRWCWACPRLVLEIPERRARLPLGIYLCYADSARGHGQRLHPSRHTGVARVSGPAHGSTDVSAMAQGDTPPPTLTIGCARIACLGPRPGLWLRSPNVCSSRRGEAGCGSARPWAPGPEHALLDVRDGGGPSFGPGPQSAARREEQTLRARPAHWPQIPRICGLA